MTASEFGSWLVAYYGPYATREQKKEVWDYISSMSIYYLDALKRVLTLNYSNTYKTPPDVAIMEKFSAQAMQIMERPKALPEPAGDYLQFDPESLIGGLMAKIKARHGRAV